MGWGLIDQDIKSLARHGRASRAGRALRQTAAAPGQPDTFELLEHNAYGAGADRRFAASRDLGDPVERFAKPLLHLDTPTSAAWVMKRPGFRGGQLV